VASDEDRGGVLTSQASFNAVAGTEYLIAVDGHAGAAGNIVLSWGLDLSTVPFPRIIAQPLSHSVAAGQDTTFSVGVNSDTPTSFQWFFGCAAILGATNATLPITNVQARDVGDYRVWVMNASSQAAISEDASLEIGPQTNFVSQAKVEDLFAALLTGPLPGPLKNGPRSDSVSQGYISVSLGSSTNQTINNADGLTALPICCGAVGGAAKWLWLRAESDGVFLLDTERSSIVPLLQVHSPSTTNLTDLYNALYLCSNLVVCANNGRPVRFAARAGTNYLAVVDGVNSAHGLINLNWKFGQPIPLPPPPPDPILGGDGSVTLQTTIAGGQPPPVYQWFRNGVLIPEATSQSWVVHSPASAQGTYSVVASNLVGSVSQTVAVLVRLEAQAHPKDGVLHLWLPSDLTLPALMLEESPDTVHWVSDCLINPGSCSTNVPLITGTNRFFRLRSAP
jgi:hypothetical protein